MFKSIIYPYMVQWSVKTLLLRKVEFLTTTVTVCVYLWCAVQPKTNVCARSGARSSSAKRTRKPPQEVKVFCFCGLPTRTFEMQEVESLTARS